MATTIKCDKCGNEIEITEAISRDLESKLIQDIKSKHQIEINSLLEKQTQLEKKKDEEIEKVKLEITETLRKEAIDKVRKEYDTKINLTKEESEAQEKQNEELQKQLTELTKQLRESKGAENKLKFDYEKQLLDAQDKIQQKAKQEAEDEFGLKIALKDKQLEDLGKQLKNAQRKVEQGSQQLQGEIQELALEDLLKQSFKLDDITEVPKGISGADVIQTVKSNSGTTCGIIVWESKNTKTWSQQWVTKLKEDTRTLKGDVCVLVSAVLPGVIKSFGQVEGVWVCDMGATIPLAFALRDRVIAVSNIKEANRGKANKAEVVYDYLISNEFRQRIEVWIEYFKSRKEELDKEKAYFIKKWDKEDKNIMRVLQSTAGMYGDLQGLIGTALPKVQYLELSEGND